MGCSRNKIPASPARTYTREFFLRPQFRLQWTSYVGQLMLHRAKGWLSDPMYFNAWDIQWLVAHPKKLLIEARLSRYPPNEEQLRKWCGLYYPDACSTFWPEYSPALPVVETPQTP